MDDEAYDAKAVPYVLERSSSRRRGSAVDARRADDGKEDQGGGDDGWSDGGDRTRGGSHEMAALLLVQVAGKEPDEHVWAPLRVGVRRMMPISQSKLWMTRTCVTCPGGYGHPFSRLFSKKNIVDQSATRSDPFQSKILLFGYRRSLVDWPDIWSTFFRPKRHCPSRKH